MPLLPLLLIGLWLAATAASAAEGDREFAQGERLFERQCRGCHSLAPGVHRAGPSLHGLIGRRAGSVAGYDYSPILEAADHTWNATTLDRFLTDPDAFLPGTRMVFWGLDARSRQHVIRFLEHATR